MSLLRNLASGIRTLFRKEQADRELDEELRAYQEMAADEKMRQGMSPKDAVRAVRLERGSLEVSKEIVRSGGWESLVGTCWQDLRFACRMLRKAPGSTAVAVLTLALGIGANTAIFSVVNGVFQRGFPASQPSQLVGLLFRQEHNSAQSDFSYPDFQDIRQDASCFSGLFAYRIELNGFQEGNQAEQVLTSFVTGNYFATLGLKPALGRLILPDEGRVPGSDPIMVLGYSYWKNRFGADPSIVGKQVLVDGHSVTVVGVAPEHFRGLFSIVDIQAYLPMNMFSIEDRDRGWVNDRTSRSLHVIGRLKPSVRPDQAQASLVVVAGQLAREYPKDWRDAKIETFPGEAANTLYAPTGDAYRTEKTAVGLFLVLSALVLLLACSNVANLLLVRATTRDQEMAVRAALGASRNRLVRQLLAENLVLAFLAGLAGMELGAAASSALSRIQLHVGIPIQLDFSFDWRVFAFVCICAIAAGVAVGVLPALRAYGADPSMSLHGTLRTTAGSRSLLRKALVAGQLAASMILMIVSGLFVRSLRNASDVALGFDPQQILNLSMDAHEIGYDDNHGRALYKDLLERIGAMPGVRSASLAFSFPTSEYTDSETVYVEDRMPAEGQAGPRVFDNSVSPGYFVTMGIPIIEGRGFEETDTHSAPRVAVVNEAMAREFWPNESSIDKRFKLSRDSGEWIHVVGVTKNSRVLDLTTEAIPAYFYLPLDQNYAELVTLQVRTNGPPEAMTSIVEAKIHSLAPGMPLFGIQTMAQALHGPKGLFHYEVGSGLGAVLGALGLVLCLVGVYGVVSFSAAQRTREIGIRIALGAQREQVLRLVLGDGVKVVFIGISIGLLGALGFSRVISSLLLGVQPTDPLTFACAVVLLVGAALLACWIPAHRATRVDPIVALRYE